MSFKEGFDRYDESVDYKKAYLTLFNAATDAIANIETGAFAIAKNILIEAQQKGENIYIAAQVSEETKVNE